MKYIIFDVRYLPTPVVFPEHLKHDSVHVPLCYKAISAGKCEIDFVNKTVCVSGNSLSLNLKSEPDDVYWLRKLFFPE